MIYGYKPIFDTHSKKEQELMIANRILNLLNKNVDSLKNAFNNIINYEQFLEVYSLETVIKHFNNNLTDSEFKIIMNNILQFVNTNTRFNTEAMESNSSNTNSYQKQLTARTGFSNVYKDNEEGNRLYEQ